MDVVILTFCFSDPFRIVYFGPLSCGGNKNGWILHQGKDPMLENSFVSFLIFAISGDL
ncbi:hypothetical protein M109_0113 [Bacteroides fragilis str. 3397 N2]|nr:hypothetical protein M109_0113 [Bacteroides fragilis str. 3397 N2]EXZ55840.1 hypothetical protein M108_0106 [Bacteroides fragilis str. 3397 T14]EYA45818.1 hypothetical protein M110_0112 [Bacteroides fragilis str. 3397 N3]